MGERIKQLLPYPGHRRCTGHHWQPVGEAMHCLTTLHNRDTATGRQICEKFALEALEVTDDIFQSSASIVFDQAENRMHTVKAAMVATIPPLQS